MKKVIIFSFILIATIMLFLFFEYSAKLLTNLHILQYYKPLEIITKLSKDNSKKEDWRLTHTFLDDTYQSDPVLFWRPRPGVAPFNSLGYKGLEPLMNKQSRTTKTYKIITYGDSNTQGMLTVSWPEELAKLIHKNRNDIDVYNAGVAGYSSYQGLQRFREDILKNKPNAIIVSFGWNDIAPNSGKPDSQYKAYLIYFQRQINSLRLFLVIKYYLNKFIPNNKNIYSQYAPRVSIEEYKKNILLFDAVAKKNNIRIIFLTRPYKTSSKQLVDKYSWRRYVPKYNEVLRETSQRHNILLIDIEKIFKSQENYFIDESHFNKEGYRKTAKIILQILSSKIF